MKYSVVYSSKTGNTARLAEKIKQALPTGDCIAFGAPSGEAIQSDVIFVGFWTDKGTCSEDVAQFLKTLESKKVFLFGTAGFGTDDAYFNQVLSRVTENLGNGNTLIGSFMCQGKMPEGVLKRYEAMKAQDPDKMQGMIENFHKAASHPDNADLENLAKAVSLAELY